MNICRVSSSIALFSLLTFGLLTLSGCGSNFADMPVVDTSVKQAIPIGSLQGRTYGGQQPIYNSHVYLMKASANGYGAASTSVLGPNANTTPDGNGNYYTTTDSSGDFNITGDYTCTYNATNPAASDQLYIWSTGGIDNYLLTNITGTGTNNPMIGLMAVLGQCPSSGTFAGTLSFIYVNEVSTVAAAYALAGFASTPLKIGSPSATVLQQQGLANAFANANQLYDVNGSTQFEEARTVTPGTGTTGIVPQALLDTLANILATCVNQTPTPALPPTGGACQILYNNTGFATDTASAAIYIAQHPASNVSALWGLQPTNVQFADDLKIQPNDFSVGITFSGTGLANPIDVAMDASGSAWITSSAGYVSKLTALGSAASGSPFSVPSANYVAVDQSGNAWVSSTGNNEIYELSSAGVRVPGTPYTNPDFNTPSAVANDGAGLTFISNPIGSYTLFGLLGQSGDLVKISGSGSTATDTIYTSSVLTTTIFNNIPNNTQVAIDSLGYVWVSGDHVNCTALVLCDGQNVQKISKTAFAIPAFTTSTAACFLFICPNEKPQGIAIDSSNQGWVAIAGTTDQLGKFSTSGGLTTYTGGGLSTPQGVAVDGANNIWIANTGNNSISQFTNSGTAVSGSGGYQGGVLSVPFNLDIDPSGDVWVVNSTGNSVTEFIGIATPVVRPISVAISSSKLGAKP